MPDIGIRKFIFHVLRRREDGFAVEFQPEITLDADSRAFFESLFQGQLSAIRYRFVPENDGTAPPMKRDTEAILDADADFQEQSRHLTQRFARKHRPQATDGVFIVSLAMLDGRAVLILMKYDDIKAVELLASADGPRVHHPDHLLTLNPKNVMKFALVDLSAAEGWEVLAYDRQARVIAQYFRDFLDITELVSPEKQTRAALQRAREWATEHADLLPEDVFPVDAQYLAATYMRQNDTFNADEFLDRVIGEETDETRPARESLRQRLQEADITADFAIDRGVVKGSLTNQTIFTDRGVRIVMPNGRENGNVRVEKDEERNEWVITIRTRQLETKA